MTTRRRILVTGGAGYVGAVLVPKLLERGHDVRVLDLYIYGDGVFGPHCNHPALEEVRGDIRDTDVVGACLRDCDTVIHLACISNDPSCDLDPRLSRSINYDAFIPLVQMCKSQGVERFVFASSSSVYGLSDAPNVTEDHPRIPVTDYNRYKAMCEDVLEKEQAPGFGAVVIRPATVCGYSPRLRLDLSVNILTNHAVNKGVITVFGGAQYRPNLHIQDMADLYVQLMEEPAERIAGKVFNVGYQNRTVSEIAEIVKGTVEAVCPDRGPIPIQTTRTDDVRSYRISCDRIARELGFRPRWTIEDATRGLCQAFAAGKVPDALTSSRYYNVTRMKEIGLT
ncbi:MAG: NAD(P)-dependent oxidoreductase [Actinobacteria bacterium]|nr:NAD(P)-dependent oxidoreductase [Actinomycetota bacterium]